MLKTSVRILAIELCSGSSEITAWHYHPPSHGAITWEDRPWARAVGAARL